MQKSRGDWKKQFTLQKLYRQVTGDLPYPVILSTKYIDLMKLPWQIFRGLHVQFTLVKSSQRYGFPLTDSTASLGSLYAALV